jgi:hypothetical protein
MIIEHNFVQESNDNIVFEPNCKMESIQKFAHTDTQLQIIAKFYL